MDKNVTHLCLLNEDPSAILSPIVDQYIPSQKLVIASTVHYRKFAQRVIDLARRRGFRAEHRVLPDTYFTEELKEAFYNIFSELDDVDNEVWFNATNGHRIYSLCAFEAARDFDIPTYVVNRTNDSLYWIHPAKKELIQIQDKLKLEEYVELYESSLITKQGLVNTPNKRKAVGEHLVKLSLSSTKALSDLNYLATASNGNNYISPNLNAAQVNDIDFQRLLDYLIDVGLIQRLGQRINFINSENRFFCNGGWLEEYTSIVVQELAEELKTIQDSAHSAVLQRNFGSKYVKNEIDVAALVNNKLHIIECKTNRLAQNSASNALYKLDSLNEVVGGVRGRAALISYFPLSDSEKLRAHELSIRVISGEQIINLKHHLRVWFTEA
jgi:hypothetical protein